MSIGNPPIHQVLFDKPGILNRVWIRFFLDIAESLADVGEVDLFTLTASSGTDYSNDIANQGLVLLTQGSENPTYETRIKSLEVELETIMEQLDTVITKMSEQYRLMEDLYMQLVINNALSLKIANASEASLGAPLHVNKLNLQEIMEIN